MSTAFVIREFNVPGPLRVDLLEDDAPFGRMEEEAGFNTGGEHTRKKVRLPGKREPLFHMLNVDDRPLVVRGRFVDYRMGRGHAKELRARIERIRERGNLLHVTWDGDQWTAILGETDFGHEDKGYFTYELTFDVALPPDTGAVRPATPRTADSDALARILAQLRARPPGPEFARGFLATLDAGMTAVENALGALQDGVRAAENARDNLTGQVRRVTSLGAQVRQQVQQVQDVMDRTSAELAGIVGQVRDVVEWAKYAGDRSAELREVSAVARDAVEQCRARERATERLYVVKAGDTLESIARTELGDASRAGELGLMDADLRVGLVLRLPVTGGTG